MNLPPADHAARSEAIVARLLALPEVAAAQTVHVYSPLLLRGEVDTRLFVAALRFAGKRVVLPRVVSRMPPVLEHVLMTPGEALRPGPYGVWEPEGGVLIDPAEIDLVVVPALGADRAGVRLGYGGGFYDAFLAGLRAATVAPVFAGCFVERLPAEPHDVPVHIVVTETETWRVPS